MTGTTDHSAIARLTAAATRYASAQARLSRSRDDLADLVRLATRNGMTEQAAADLVGVTRMTIRKWAGK